MDAAGAKRVAQGAGLVLVGIGLAPLVVKAVTFVVSWVVLAPGSASDGAATIKVWLARMAVVRVFLVLPLVPGTWRFAQGQNVCATLARVLSVVVVVLTALVAFAVHRFLEGREGRLYLAATITLAIASTALDTVLAIVCAITARELDRPGLRRFARVATGVCLVAAIIGLASLGIMLPRLLLVVVGVAEWVMTVSSVWATGRAARDASARTP
jgi:hypothetical protein